MTDPATALPPEWQRWQSGLTEPLPEGQVADDTVNVRLEVVVAALVTAYSVVLGAVVGLIWPRVAPHVDLVAAIGGSEAATKALLGDDLWLALLGLIAGIVSVAVLNLVARDAAAGPGGLLGLALGGVLGSLVAAHVGHVVQHPHVVSALTNAYPGISAHTIASILGYFDFRVRAGAVLLAWPVAAVATQAGVVLLRTRQASRR
jgi:hypothetical protein